ncbi:phosphoribosyl 1,2-cyclic phosphodiesterase [Janthinobacterium sp. 35]|uniref:MBL fold metallo-hydrolase n=1 Tax=Janthinobacterium sp. 35 TaxID=2035210 RepID=UPI000C17DB32|nr:MBL fold metallo-hydrolase [Janthinobacterium sp. 35]PIG29501.1 phosphoribosyl 1,2-cyclic phosphodiesterase [Janthinobacterium sp. 35]
MKFTFRGVRGSIPSPGPHTVRYGGNTTCIEVRTASGALLVLDGGSGIFALAGALPPGPATAHILITHSHWDHIHGLPMFAPLFIRGSRVRLYGAADAAGNGIEHVMATQLQNNYFPVSEAAMAAEIDYRTLAVGERADVADAVVTNARMNHPVINLGYRIESGGASLFFSGDHEPFDNPHASGSPAYAACQAMIAQRQAAIDQTIAGVDALIMDCSYTRDEYETKRGWGHGTFDGAFELALRCGAKRLYCTHHEPGRSDDQLEAAFADVMARFAGRLGALQVFLAAEGMTVELG